MKKVLAIFVAGCLVVALFTVVFLSVPSAKATTFSTSTVTFDTQGGSTINPITVVTNTQAITAPDDPSYPGHTFAGWYTEIGYVNIYDFSTIVRTDFTLYAKWTDNTPTTYAVAFHMSAGSGDIQATVDGVAITTGDLIAAGKTVIFTATPGTGYQVSNWNLNDATVNGNLTNTLTVPNITEAIAVVVQFEATQTSVPVASIVITGAGNATTVTTDGTLAMSAAVSPANATDPSVSWSWTTLAGGTVSIGYPFGYPSAQVLVTGGEVGTLTMTATANDGSGVTGTEVITVNAVTHYGIWVGGVEATSANAANISGTGITGTVTYDAVNNVLTLNNAQITGYYADTWSNGAGIYAATVDLKITLIGSSTINITLPFRGAGIMNQGKGVSLNGTGSLAITLGGSPSQFAMGIWSTTASYINGCTVTVTGGNTTGTSNALSSGIYVTAGTLSIENATVTAAGGTTSGSNASYGISAGGLAVTNSTVTATGNTQAVSVGGYVALNGSSIMAGSSTDGTGATSVSNLTGQAGYKYVKISAPLLVNTVTFTTAGPIAKLTGDTAFTNAATGNGTGEITYSSGNTSTATVGASGEVTILAVGSTVITATQAADATYATGTATYTLTVTAPPTKYTITFSVTGANGTLGATVDTMAIATGDQAVEGKNVVFTAVPAMGYQVKAWTVDDAVEAGNVTNNLTITSLAADTAVTVEFETIPYTYSINGPEFENVTITSYTGTGGDVIIPDTLDTYPVTAIGDYAFFNCAGLTSVTIPASVTAIGDKAFYLCTGLTGILVDGSNPNYTSVDGVLYNKASTVLIQYPTGNTRTSFTIPDSVTSIGDSAFANCTSLTSVTIPVSVTTIGDSAFNACSGLTSVTIPVGVTSIGFGVFQGCSALTSVTIPAGVTSIGTSAFYGTGLTSVTIPGSVTRIDYAAFANCTDLTSVTIPASVTSLGNDVFYYCTRLAAAHFLGNAPTTMGIDVFGHCATGFTVYYVSGTTDWTTPTWYGYPTIVEAPTAAEVAALITTISAPAKDATSLTLPTVAEGYTIAIKSSDTLGVITLGGTIVPLVEDETVALVLTVTRTSDNSTADTASINVVVPAKTVVAPTAAEVANAAITVATGLVPATKTVVETTDSNLLTMLQAIAGMSDTSVTLTLEVTGNTNVTVDGTIIYTSSEVVGNVIVKINKTNGTEQIATVAVTVPAHAVSTAATYSVTFDSQGGSTVASITGIISGAFVTLSAAPMYAGYTLNGWFTATTGGTAFTAATAVTADVTVYAQWAAMYIPTPTPIVVTPTPIVVTTTPIVVTPTPIFVTPTPVSVKKPLILIFQINNTMFWDNSVPAKLDSTPVIKNSRTLLPLRAIIEALAGTVAWDPIAQKVTVTLGLKTVILWIGKSIATVNGGSTPIDVTSAKVVPEIINGRTMLPLRFIAENLGAIVGWEQNTQTITITYTP